MQLKYLQHVEQGQELGRRIDGFTLFNSGVSMSVVVRLEKVKLAVDEMKLALKLATFAPDDFIARMLARHVIIRTNDFIAHIRRLREPLKKAGFDTKSFHSAKEIYAKNFDEYFRVTRNRLGAHVQDFDFGKRLELWNDIEIKKTEFFTEGAEEIYKHLEAMGIPGFVNYIDPSELNNKKFEAFLSSYKLSFENEYGIEIGTDPLAMTRANTSAVLNLTPPHIRAGQLNLIKRWIKSERELLNQLSEFPSSARIIKARIITDIVSFFDCLITRPLPVTAPQYMEGLDAALINAGDRSSALEQFAKNYSYQSRLDELRRTRDTYGGHLEESDALPVASLLSSIDGIDMAATLRLYDIINQLFEKVCFEIFYLRTHVVDGKRMRGVTAGATSVIPFNESNPIPTVISVRLDHNNWSVQTYQHHLDAWLTGDSSSKSEAQHYFWNAFLHSDAIESFIEREDFDGGSFRSETHQWKSASEFILQSLVSERNNDIASAILQLLVDCRSSDPYLVSEIIVRFSACSNAYGKEVLICFSLGELASYPHISVKTYLDQRVRSPISGDIQFHAIFASFKIFIRSEGLIRINQKRKRWLYDLEVGRLIKPMSEFNRLFFSIVFISQFSSQQFGFYARVFTEECDEFRSTITSISHSLIPLALFDPISDIIRQAQKMNDYIGVSCLLADQLKASGNHGFSEHLLNAACNGIIVAPLNDQGQRNLAVCFLRIKSFEKSLEIAEHLARRNPDDIQAQIFVAAILRETPAGRERALEVITKIRSQYKLEAADIDALLLLENSLSGEIS